MKRSEYLMTLYDALNDIPAEERTDIVSEYQEYFKSEMEKGCTEEEICLSLGDPVTLAYAIKQRRGYGKFANNPSRKQVPTGFLKLAKVIAGIFIAMAVFSVFGFSISNDIGRGDLNLGIGEKYNVNEEKDIDLGSADNIVIRVISSDTKVMVSDGDTVRASLKGTVRTTNKDAVPGLEVARNGSSILIAERRDDVNLGYYISNVNMDITIPREFKGKISFEGASCDLAASDLDVESVSIDLTSGDIKLDDIALDGILGIVTTSGNIDIKRLKAKEASIESISGDKVLESILVDGAVNIISTSGKSVINGMDSGNLAINSLSGNMEIIDLNSGVQAESTSGNINLSLSKVTDGIDINALSGDVELRLPSDSDFSFVCTVGSGNIYCDFALEEESPGKRSLRDIYGKGDVPINIRTTSGNISLKKK